ncbi:hypothetical protein JW935_18195 [candidate division KSB1 bacterium]|nr:hypothetical protein [candidate division KSB1 bacterium]
MIRLKSGIRILLFLLISASYAQDNSKILSLNGGHIRTRVTLYNHLFSAVGGENANLGGSLTESGVTALFYNPALTSTYQRPTGFLELSPGYGIDVGSLGDINSHVKSSTDAAIQEYKDQSILLTYPFVQSAYKTKTRLNAGGLIVPVKDWVVGAYFYSPLDLQLDGLVTGSAAQINSKLVVSDDEDDVFFNGFVNGHINFHTGLFASGLNISRQFSRRWSAGFLLRYYRFSAHSDGLMNVEGTMLYGGRENTFKDPNDNWHNDLDQAVDAQFKGKDLGWSVGALYQLDENISFAALLDWMPDITASGHLHIVNNRVPALNLDTVTGDSDGEIFQAEKLKLSQLTLTETIRHQTFSQLKLRLPKFIKLGAGWRKGWFSASLSYSYGFSPLSFVYGKDEIGIKPEHRLTAGLDFKYVQAGLGFLTLKKFSNGSENLGTEPQHFILPVFTLGSFFKFKEDYTVYVSLILDPVPAIKLGYGYQF